MCIAKFWNHQNEKKFGQVLVNLQALYIEGCIWDYTNMWRKNLSRFLRCYMPYLEYEGIWRAMLFRDHVLSDVLPPMHYNNDDAHKLFSTSSQNSTFSLTMAGRSCHCFLSPFTDIVVSQGTYKLVVTILQNLHFLIIHYWRKKYDLKIIMVEPTVAWMACHS